MSTTFDWKKLQRIYTTKLQEIQRGINLEKNLHEIEDAIAEIDDIILEEKEKGLVTPAYNDVRNDFLHLKHLISERQ